MSTTQQDDINRTNSLTHAATLAREQIVLAKEIVTANWSGLTNDAQANAVAAIAGVIAVNLASKFAQQAEARKAEAKKK